MGKYVTQLNNLRIQYYKHRNKKKNLKLCQKKRKEK